MMMRILYPDIDFEELPLDTVEELAKQAVWFLDRGEETKATSKARVYSFAKDADLIFGAFKQTHNIDIDTVDMHWWKFVTLFMAGFSEDTAFSNLVSLRKRHAEHKTTKEERAAIAKMRDIFDLPRTDKRTLEQKRNANKFFELAEEGKKRKNELRQKDNV